MHLLKKMICMFAVFLSGPAISDEIRVLSVGSAEMAIKSLIPEFNKMGHAVKFEWGPPNIVWNRIQGGEKFDVVILSTPAMTDLINQKRAQASTKVSLARTGIGVVIPAAKTTIPDISTIDNFKMSIVSADKIAYRNPTLPNMSGEMVEKILKKIGVYESVESKLIVLTRPAAEDMVGDGQVDFSFVNLSEIPIRKDIRFIGAIPLSIQLYTNLEAAIATSSVNSGAAIAFHRLISGKEARTAWESAGFESALAYMQ
jgi:molybdate transport system substrate-binding protein